LMENLKRERFSVVHTENGLVTGFGGMPVPGADGPPPLMFTGIQIFDHRIFKYIPTGVFSHSVTDVFPQAIAAGERIVAHVGAWKWRELSTLRRYLDISLEMLAERGETLSAGAGCIISDTAQIQQSILWDKVKVDQGAKVTRAVIGDGVSIGANEFV